MSLDMLYAIIGPDGATPGLIQMCWRALIVLAVGLVLVRLAGKRLFGRWGAIDIVLSIIIGSNLSRALTGGAPFVATIGATLLLVLLHMALTQMAARWPALGPVLKGSPRQLMREGRFDERALRRSGVGQHDLDEAFRASGVVDRQEADQIWIERDGSISILKRR
jgi:uncharacterized membrane protein YcaP (DUF421 family)